MANLLRNNQIDEDENISEADSLRQILYWIGFRTETQRNHLITDSLTSYEDLQFLDDKEVEKTRGDLGTRSATARKFIFGTNRTKPKKTFLNEFYRIAIEPSIVGLNEIKFRKKLRLENDNADLEVFNMIVSFTTGQPSGDWIKDTPKYLDGWKSMNALRLHFASESNASRTIADADRL